MKITDEAQPQSQPVVEENGRRRMSLFGHLFRFIWRKGFKDSRGPGADGPMKAFGILLEPWNPWTLEPSGSLQLFWR
jgi:hypothetical protein